jgi:hypothetical protein
MTRSRRSAPYTASPSTHPHGTPGVERAGDHLARDLRLGPERHVLGDLGGAAPPGVGGPALGQVEPAVDQRVAPRLP